MRSIVINKSKFVEKRRVRYDKWIVMKLSGKSVAKMRGIIENVYASHLRVDDKAT